MSVVAFYRRVKIRRARAPDGTTDEAPDAPEFPLALGEYPWCPCGKRMRVFRDLDGTLEVMCPDCTIVVLADVGPPRCRCGSPVEVRVPTRGEPYPYCPEYEPGQSS